MATRASQGVSICIYFLLFILVLGNRPAPGRSGSKPAAATAGTPSSDKQDQILKPLHAGYIPLSSKQGSSLYYAYWEASAIPSSSEETPIILWLQGGPGCASTFGALYEIGTTVVGADGKPTPNPWSWNRNHGLLVVDQPIGTGYSIAGSTDDIPEDMLGMAEDLYAGLCGFFDAHPELQHRPFVIAGESYAGKYIPSITHYILQAEAYGTQHSTAGAAAVAGHGRQQQQQQVPCSSSSTKLPLDRNEASPALLVPLFKRKLLQQPGSSSCGLLKHARPFSNDVLHPNFNLTAIAIGNGLTDPVSQTRALAGVIFNMGMVTEATRRRMQDQAEVVVQLVEEQQWAEAVQMRSKLIDFIQDTAGVATLLDVRRTAAYDAGEAVQNLLNSVEVKAVMSADPNVSYSSCSGLVETALSADTMKSSQRLVEDILGVLPVLLYQGQFDGQDGVASSNAWISSLDWEYERDFGRLEGELWWVDGVPAGWRRNVSTLTQVMVRNAGHMVPRDQPEAAQQLLEGWVAGVLEQLSHANAAAAATTAVAGGGSGLAST